jgi:replicative DNA helicase
MLMPENIQRKDRGAKKKYSTQNEADPLRGPRIPPQDLDAEKALLGSLLLSSESMFDIADLITRNSFYAEKHAIIYDAIEELIHKKEPVDLLTVTGKLRDRKELEQVGGSPYLSDLLSIVGSASNIKYYAQIVRKKELLRRLIETSNHIGEIAYDEARELEEVLDEPSSLAALVPKTNAYTNSATYPSARPLGNRCAS